MQPETSMTQKKIIGLVIVIASLLYFFNVSTKKTQPALPVPSVEVQHPVQVERADYFTVTGNTVAYYSVDLVARVEGYLQHIAFTDGAFVKKGQELFLIEPDPYRHKLEGAEASVASSKAGLAYAKAESARQQAMYKERATSLSNVEVWQSKLEQSQADIAKAKAEAENAAISYGYTRIVSPFDGRIGRHLVDVGNLVGHGEATTLATVEQIDSIYVYFNVNELDLLRIREAARAQGIHAENMNQVAVAVKMQDETEFSHQGHLNFVSTGLDASMGTMEFRALLPNSEYQLLPGLFVQVRIALSEPTLQWTIPDSAIQMDQIGPYVLTVDETNHVVLKRVKKGSVEQGMRAILQGVDGQDQVIVSGLQFATPGQPVEPRQVTEDAP